MVRPVIAALLALLMLGSGGYVGYDWAKEQLYAPGPQNKPVIFEVKQGESLLSILEKLEAEGLLRQPHIAKFYVRLKPETIQAGEFELPAGASFFEIMEILNQGNIRHYKITFPEGMTVRAILNQLKNEITLSGNIATLPEEGSLLADTYFIRKNQPRSALIEQMHQTLEQKLDKLWHKRQKNLPFKTPEEALILASIVQKEAGPVSEQPLVASVFINRLRAGWRLQADSTLVYYESQGQGKLGRGLKRSELTSDHPYNTYTRRGLPPTPIANIGLSALKAVLQPVSSDYFYFVADGTGGHAFAKTLKQHNANVAKWRKIEKEKRTSLQK